jgi:hypothetical protein
MNLRICGLLAIAVVLACGLLPTATQAQFTQQGPKLVGAGAVPTPPFSGAGQGESVSLSADGNTAIVGGPFDNNEAGAAWVHTRCADAQKEGPEGRSKCRQRSDGVWSQQAKLVGTTNFADYGLSVSLSADGNTAIVGGPNDNNETGAAWVYTRSGGVWSQQAKLVGTGVVGPYALQGWSVSLSADGKTAIVGGPGDNATLLPPPTGGFVGIGAAWVFTRAGRVWTQQIKLVGTGAVGSAEQGHSVSLSGAGNTAIVGGPFDNNTAGAAWVFAQPVFAGTSGKANCYDQSVSALARQHHGLNDAAAARGFSSVRELQNAISEFCEG